MARTFLTNIDLNWIELLKLRLQNLAVEPTSPQPGWVFFDTAADAIKVRNAANTAWIAISADAPLDVEQVQDIVGAMVSGGTEAGITVTYDDTNARLDFTVTDSPLLNSQNGAYYLSRTNHTGTQTSATISDFTEAAQDAVGAALTDTATLDFTYNDASNTISAAVLDSPTLAGNNSAYYLNRTNHTGTQASTTISDWGEAVADSVGTMIAGNTETGITVTYDDTDNTLDFVVTDSPLLNGQNAAYYLARANHTGTQASTTISDWAEAVQDTAAALITGATHTNLTATYNDTTGLLALAVSGLASTNISDFNEAAQDAVGTIFVDSSTIDFTYTDATPSITAAVLDSPLLGGQNSAYHRARANHTGTQTASTISDFDTQVRTNRLDQMAAPTAAVALNSQRITGLADGTGATDAVTKQQLDAVSAGLSWKDSVRVASTTNLTLSGTQTIDDISVIAGDRVLVKNQTTASQNGIYVVAAGAWSRATDADTAAELEGSAVFVEEGTTNADSGWTMTTDNPTLGTTSLVWSQFSGLGQITAGTGLAKTGNTLNVGAGTGMVANADDVAVLRTDANGRVPLRYAVDFGNGAAQSFNIDHNLNSLDVVVAVYRKSDGAEVMTDVTRSTVNRVVIATTGVVPASNEYRCVVIG